MTCLSSHGGVGVYSLAIVSNPKRKPAAIFHSYLYSSALGMPARIPNSFPSDLENLISYHWVERPAPAFRLNSAFQCWYRS
jgi:hypothetical protein